MICCHAYLKAVSAIILRFLSGIRYSSNVTLHSLKTFCSHLTFTISSLQACHSKVALHLVYNKTKLFNYMYIKPSIILSTYHRVYSLFSKFELNHTQHHALLCWNHVTYCLFESASCAKQENLSRLKIIAFPSRIMAICFILWVMSSIE